MLIGVILNDCFMTDKVSPIEIAQIGQWAENVYFGKPCGLMDQMASSVGNIITIDFADPAHPDVEPVPVDFSKAGLALCILDSCADHADLTDEYAAVPAECRAVAAVCGGEVLRDVPFETFLAKLPECRRQCGDRAVLRAFHIYADNDRVAKQVAALREGDFSTFLRLVNESGHSSWEYLQNVIPAGYKEHQEMGVTIAAAKHYLNGKGAVRVHGGGFAGTAQAFVPVEMLADFKKNMEAILGEGRCHVLSIRPERRRCPVISTAIQQLVNYGLDTGLILPDDEIYIRNQLLMTMQLDDFTAPEGEVCYTDLESILKTLVDDAAARGVCEDNSTARDLFDTKLMGVLTPRPSIVRANFEERYENEGPQAATDWFYKFSQDTDYIRRYRIKRDLKWVTKTSYGDLDITINLSKPEKDPKAIAAAKLAPQSAYPKCQLCAENEGYAGRMNHPARENHRIIPLTINDSAWNLQYSPYVYYNEHCIVFNNLHTPMKIERATFRKLLDFVGLFPTISWAATPTCPSWAKAAS